MSVNLIVNKNFVYIEGKKMTKNKYQWIFKKNSFPKLFSALKNLINFSFQNPNNTLKAIVNMTF